MLWHNPRTADEFTACFFFFSSRRRHTRFDCDWSSDVCSSDLGHQMRKFLTKYSAAGTFETVDHFCRTSSRVRCDKQMYVVWHHFHSLDEHAVLLCRGIQNVLEPLFHFTDKNFAAILRAEHDVVRQVEDGSGVLDVTTVFWRLKSYVISLPRSYLFFKYLYALTCRLKSGLRRAVTYRFSVSCLPTQDLVAREANGHLLK